MYYLKMFGISLILTLVIELPAAFLLGVRKKQDLLIVFLVNVLTNPAAVFLCLCARSYLTEGYIIAELFVEVLVVVTEGLIYRGFSVKGKRIRQPFLLSFILNAASYLMGVVINLIQ